MLASILEQQRLPLRLEACATCSDRQQWGYGLVCRQSCNPTIGSSMYLFITVPHPHGHSRNYLGIVYQHIHHPSKLSRIHGIWLCDRFAGFVWISCCCSTSINNQFLYQLGVKLDQGYETTVGHHYYDKRESKGRVYYFG